MKQAEDDKILHEIICSLKDYNEDYIDGAWERFLKKQQQSKRKALVIFLLRGVAALFLLCCLIHSPRYFDLNNHCRKVSQVKNEVNFDQEEISEEKGVCTNEEIFVIQEDQSMSNPVIEKLESKEVPRLKIGEAPALVLASCALPLKSKSKGNSSQLTVIPDSSINILRDTVFLIEKGEDKHDFLNERNNYKKISVGLLLKGVTNTTSTSSNQSIAFGVINEVKINQKFSASLGVIFDKYHLSYHQTRVYSDNAPVSKDAELLCLDIPVNLKMKLTELSQGELFVSGGFSTLAFIKETYRKNYDFTESTQSTVNFENINFAGQLNLSSGWQFNFSSRTNMAIEMYLKVPLYRLAEENLHFYQSGVTVRISR